MLVNRTVKLALSAVLLVLAGVRWIYYDQVSAGMDLVFFSFILAAFLLPLVPWEHLTSIKAAGIEMSLERPQVQGAINSLGLERIQDQVLKEKLSKLNDELESARGSKVLWIDDQPHAILGERRLLRALGINVISATSSEKAEEILNEDDDFDLIITDVQRQGNSYKVTHGVEIHEGTNFIVKLRKKYKDTAIAAIPVIFYAAYSWDPLVEFTRVARETLPEPELSNSVIDFVPKMVKCLAEVRQSPIISNPKKVPTDIRWEYSSE